MLPSYFYSVAGAQSSVFYTAAGHQREMTMLQLHFWEAVTFSSLFMAIQTEFTLQLFDIRVFNVAVQRLTVTPTLSQYFPS